MNVRFVSTLLLGFVLAAGGFYLFLRNDYPKAVEGEIKASIEHQVPAEAPATETEAVIQPSDEHVTLPTEKTTATSSKATGLSRAELLLLADAKYADGTVPLGDDKYVTDAPKKGYIYLCNVHKDNPGSMVLGTWMNSNNTWNFLKKIAISGSVTWPNAVFSNVVAAGTRVLAGNGLPINHTTGTFPVQANDPAAQFDKNPNTISIQTLKKSLPSNPVYSDAPYCMGGEVGIMLTGVPLFNGFDAGLRDAAAHELQDSCNGHPQGSGQYHYHSLSSCFKDTDVETVLGYAYDGFPITGPEVAADKYLTTEDLDACHGIISEVTIDGKKKMTYHYVMTRDFPYSASCFRGKPITTGPSAGGGMQQNQTSQQPMAKPPQEAISACVGKQTNSQCSFTGGRGTISGTCQTPPDSSLACVPNR